MRAVPDHYQKYSWPCQLRSRVQDAIRVLYGCRHRSPYTVLQRSTCLSARGVERGLTIFDTVCAVVHILHGRRQQTRNCGRRLGDPHLTEKAGRRSNMAVVNTQEVVLQLLQVYATSVVLAPTRLVHLALWRWCPSHGCTDCAIESLSRRGTKRSRDHDYPWSPIRCCGQVVH